MKVADAQKRSNEENDQVRRPVVRLFHLISAHKIKSKMMDIKYFFLWCIICCIYFSFTIADSFSDIVNAPNFREIDLSLNEKLITEKYDAGNPAIQSLRVIDANDTSVLISWTYNIAQTNLGFPNRLVIELAEGHVCEDFYQIDVLLTDTNQLLRTNLLEASYLISHLTPLSPYRVRIVPEYTGRNGGRSFPSTPLVISTIASPINYWERVYPRRKSKIWYGRGFSDPVRSRPHLSEGVEIYSEGTHFDSLWWSDAPTLNTPVFPSGRRGHSMTLIDNYLYMFGGRTNGLLIDFFNFFSSESFCFRLFMCQHFHRYNEPRD
jgi:hypothetical protein